jgi:hypothetical protein
MVLAVRQPAITKEIRLCYFVGMGNKQRIKLEDELIDGVRRKHGEAASRELVGYFAQGNKLAAIRRCRELGVAIQD